MTYDELCNKPFRVVCHLNMGDMHATTYQCCDPAYSGIFICDHVPYRDGEPYGRSYRHWNINGIICKSKKNLIKAIEEI